MIILPRIIKKGLNNGFYVALFVSILPVFLMCSCKTESSTSPEFTVGSKDNIMSLKVTPSPILRVNCAS